MVEYLSKLVVKFMCLSVFDTLIFNNLIGYPKLMQKIK